MNSNRLPTGNAQVVFQREKGSYETDDIDPSALEVYGLASLPWVVHRSELVFDAWRWFWREYSIDESGNILEPAELEELTVEQAYERIKHLCGSPDQEMPKELDYHRWIGIPALVRSCEDKSTHTFDPQDDGWTLRFSREGSDHDLYVFEANGDWVEISVDGTWRDPFIRRLSLSQAADLFVLSNLEVPEYLQPHRTIKPFRPRPASSTTPPDDQEAAAAMRGGIGDGGEGQSGRGKCKEDAPNEPPSPRGDGGDQPPRNDGSEPEPLTSAERDILVAMAKLKATADKPCTQVVISVEAFQGEADIGGQIGNMKSKGLVAAGRGVGTYLTTKGIERAKRIIANQRLESTRKVPG